MGHSVEINLEERLVAKAKLGELSAMRKLYDQYSKAMLNTAYRIVNNVEDAEDVLQESFIAAFKSIHQFSSESTFGAWLKRITVNQSLELLRRNNLNLKFQDAVLNWYEDIEQDYDQSELDLVYSTMMNLPDGYRTVFSLYLIEGYDHKEISEILNISESTSRTQLRKAKVKLKELIKISQSVSNEA
ncbi:MAG: RNA polymerase sigma factor [Flavobacteriales bacterium]|nr:RNA polymerase sigma factor [Flavobacteriales bacterium]